MKPGMKIGRQATIHVDVTPEMYARFAGQIVHPAYSTVSMVYHMEWAARQIILPFLEEDEEGIGAEVHVKHLAPAVAGTTIAVTATFTERKGRAVICEVEAYRENEKIGEGRVTQFILLKKEIEGKLQQSRSST